ncbi:LamG-like jellyroll fold domain-containing protein [Sulfurimonas sp. NW9]|uniref:LamG-like jellyroll fold domain-containing protein n=1 Tax=Sulfurimonas sp. NW9 TaxID=2922728 RepID=UPI003DAA49F2
MQQKRIIIKILLLLSLFSISLYADIQLTGNLHPGDNVESSFIPSEPLTNDTEDTYDYYLNNPTKFYLSENSDITAVELVNAVGIDSAIRVYIDGNLVGTGASGSAAISLDTTLSLVSGYHDIAVRGSCYDRRGNELACSSGQVRDIDDFNFSALKLISQQTTIAYNFLTKQHLGDNNDDDDNYDIDNTSYAYYPDAPSGTSIDYPINETNSFIGFRIFIARMRDIHENGINKVEVFDLNNNLIVSWDINSTSTDKFDFDQALIQNINGISKVRIQSGNFTTQSGVDDISFDELILIPYTSVADAYPKPIIDYRMDECSWDSDSNTYEIKNDGTLGSDYNATALNDANVTDGKIYTGGNFIAPKQIVPQNVIPLSNKYTVATWIQFPLDTNNHEIYSYQSGFTSYEEKYFNIADRDGASDSFIFFKYYRTKFWFFSWSAWKWAWCVDAQNGTPTCKDLSLPNDWTLVDFISANGQTTIYYNGNEEDTINNALENIQLDRIGASDFYGDNDGNTTIGASMDEFKIFDGVLSQNDIQAFYNNENSGNNYNGTSRAVPQCGGGNQNNNKTTLFNAVSSIGGVTCNAVNDWDNNLTTQIVNKPYGLYILSKDALTQTAPSVADITKVTLKYYDDGNTTDCGGNLLANVVKCDDATSTTCNDTNASGCAYYDNMTIDRAVKCVQVYIEGRDQTIPLWTQTALIQVIIMPYAL